MKRFTTDSSGHVYLHLDDGTEREFFVPGERGYVREVTSRGNQAYSDRQVCVRLNLTGPTLKSSKADLLDTIRHEYRSAVAAKRRRAELGL